MGPTPHAAALLRAVTLLLLVYITGSVVAQTRLDYARLLQMLIRTRLNGPIEAVTGLI